MDNATKQRYTKPAELRENSGPRSVVKRQKSPSAATVSKKVGLSRSVDEHTVRWRRRGTTGGRASHGWSRVVWKSNILTGGCRYAYAEAAGDALGARIPSWPNDGARCAFT